MIVADTDVLIDFLRGQGACARVALEIERGALATTTVSRFELLSGARTERQQQAISDLLAVLPLLPFNERAADLAALARLDLEGRGQRIGMADFMIAGITLAHELRLLTRNRCHFERIPRLELVRFE
jgi:predicted nucleic acid-binding protein